MSKRIQDLKSPMAKWRAAVWEKISGPFESLTDNQKFWIGFGVLCLVTTLLLHNPFWRSASGNGYQEGDIARESIISPADIYFVDEEATERNRQIARETVTPIFSYEPSRDDEAVQSFRSAWDNLTRTAANTNTNINRNGNGNANWVGAGGAGLGKVFNSRRFTSNEIAAVERILRESSAGDIYGDQDEAHLQGQISIVNRQRPTDSRVVSNPASTMTKLCVKNDHVGPETH